MPDLIRVLIVDDSAFVRRAVARMLQPLKNVEVVGTAATGSEGLRLTGELHPDVVILDVNMPEMDGLEALRRIMQEHPTSVLMLSTLTQQGADVTMRALELGAVDFVDKASTGTVIDIYSLAPLLREKVLAIAGATVAEPKIDGAAAATPEPPPAVGPPSERMECDYDVVAIGSSTGGPRALVDVLAGIPQNLGAGIVIAQHMPPGFTHTLAERLNRLSEIEVREARDGDRVRPGEALIGPGGQQLTVDRAGSGLRVRVESGTPESLHRPSVNQLLTSVAESSGSRAVGVVLTGMGDDGATGLRKLREAGARTIVESEATAVIYGMPRAAAPSAEFILPLRLIGPAVAALCEGKPVPGATV